MIAIIIINFKSEERTVKYVREEISKINYSHKIVIVNNEANKESDHYLSQKLNGYIIHDINDNIPTCDCYIISNPENSGFAKGNNIGVQFAILHFNIEYILFTNNDIKFITKDVVEKLIFKLKQIPDAGIIGPKVIGLKGELQSPEPFYSFCDRHIWMYLSTPFYSKKKKIERFKLNYAQNAKEGFHYKVMGSFFIVRCKDFIECGMMDPNTFLYAEETILTERMKKINKKVYYYPEVVVLHEHGTTTKKHLKNRIKEKIAFNSECYYYKTYIHTNKIQIFIGKLFFNLLSIIR